MDIALVTGTTDLPFDVSAVDGTLVSALERRGARLHRPVWHDASVAWERFDLALVRTTWDYHHRRDAFVAWAAAAGAVTRLWNPPDVVRWNTHKSYLLELEDRGAPVVPTAWLGRGDRIDLAALLAARDWSVAVVKPAVGASADGVIRVAARSSTAPPGSAAAAGLVGLAPAQRHLDDLLATGDVLVQPYLTAVEAHGELSVVVVDGEVTHAVRKRPAAGDFRVQEEYGGHAVVVVPDPEVAALARWVVEATGAQVLVARVDLLRDAAGSWQLAELELTEPDLFLSAAPAAAERLADAIVARAGGSWPLADRRGAR
jgi:glutathione synthase/RimK-type ligase-like ATP-grasp enzyme